jgi:lipopolysaccharide export system permease protein
VRKNKDKLLEIGVFRVYSLLDRYIVSEISLIFLFGLGILASLGVAIGTLSDLGYRVSEFNLPLHLAFQVLLWKIPEFVAYALPISLLLATLVSYGRFSTDSELIAWRSCGLSLYRLVAPAIILSVFISLVTLIFNEFVVPSANYRAAQIIAGVTPEEERFTQHKDIFYPEYKNGQNKQSIETLFYAKRFDGQGMEDITILIWNGQKLEKILFANRAIWDEYKKSWLFTNGSIYDFNDNYVNFEHYQMPLSSAPLELAQKSRDPFQMNIAQSLDYLKIIVHSGDEKKISMFQVRTQQKMAFPFICIVFGLIGSALGIRPQHQARGTSLGITVMIVFLYYLFGFLIGALGLVGVVSPFMAAWLPNILGLIIGGGLLVKNNG